MNYDYNVELYSWEAIRNKLLNQILYINTMLPLIASTLLSIPSTNTPSERNFSCVYQRPSIFVEQIYDSCSLFLIRTYINVLIFKLSCIPETRICLFCQNLS